MEVVIVIKLGLSGLMWIIFRLIDLDWLLVGNDSLMVLGFRCIKVERGFLLSLSNVKLLVLSCCVGV